MRTLLYDIIARPDARMKQKMPHPTAAAEPRQRARAPRVARYFPAAGPETRRGP